MKREDFFWSGISLIFGTDYTSTFNAIKFSVGVTPVAAKLVMPIANTMISDNITANNFFNFFIIFSFSLLDIISWLTCSIGFILAVQGLLVLKFIPLFHQHLPALVFINNPGRCHHKQHTTD